MLSSLSCYPPLHQMGSLPCQPQSHTNANGHLSNQQTKRCEAFSSPPPLEKSMLAWSRYPFVWWDCRDCIGYSPASISLTSCTFLQPHTQNKTDHPIIQSARKSKNERKQKRRQAQARQRRRNEPVEEKNIGWVLSLNGHFVDHKQLR